MFDGAAIYTASEAIDLLDEQQSFQTQSDPSQIISDVTSITDNPESRKEIVFMIAVLMIIKLSWMRSTLQSLFI